jgi:FAD/FMN-containing dehydrogenase
VVLADGKLVEASATTNPELFWALKGAGHNFGILTSLEVKVYDVQSNWTVHSFVFASDHLEDLFKLINRLEEPTSNRSANLALTGVFTRIPAVDPANVGYLSLTQQYLHLHRLACHSIQCDLPRYRIECTALCGSV